MTEQATGNRLQATGSDLSPVTRGLSPVRRRELHAVWRQYCPVPDSRDDRLKFVARTLGRTVESTADLTDDEARAVIAAIRAAMKQGAKRVKFPLGAPDEDGGASKEQVWKIAQLEHYLGWASVHERLDGFLKNKFGTPLAVNLSAHQAWKAIEALIAVAAREAVKRREGQGYKVTQAELRQEIRRVKELLKTWRPPNGTSTATA